MGEKARTAKAPFQDLVRVALRNGASRAGVISAEDVVIDKRVRLKCLVPRCENYGRHLLCPPNTLPVDEFQEIVKAYSHALLVQLDASYDSTDKPKSPLGKRASQALRENTGNEPEHQLHRIVNEVEREAFKRGSYFAAGLIGSDCALCTTCVGVESGSGCRHPFEARPSMQSMGIDVIRTCEAAGMPIALSSREKVRWTGLVFLD